MTSLQNQPKLRHPESRAFETRPFAKWLTKPLVLLCIVVVVLLSGGEAALCNEVLIKNITDNVLEVFDVRGDPAEQKNLLDADPKAGDDVRKALQQFIDTDPG